MPDSECSSSRASSRTLADPYTVFPQEERKLKLKQRASQVYVLGEPIVICGVTLKPTAVFDTFWKFAAERKAIDDKRRAGGSWPWTEDPILQSHFFCNSFRVLDKLSQYIIKEVVEKGSQNPEEISFRIVLFNLFTKIETWEMLSDQVGPLKWATYDRAKYAKVLHKAKAAGQTLYTGAFQKPAPKFESPSSYVNHLILLEVLMDQKLWHICMSAKHMADVYEWLISFPSMGEFATYQLMLNLSYSRLLKFHRNDFVVPGPGASSGLTKLFGQIGMAAGKRVDSHFEVEVIRWLTATQTQHFKQLGLMPPTLGRNHLLMDVADIEHTLCEVDKYARVAHPGFKGKRTELWRKFEAKSPLPKAVFPRVWTKRRKPKVRSNKDLAVEKRYTVAKIKRHRVTERGMEYLISWWGYPASDDTWEPESTFQDDARSAVQDYWKKLNTKQK